MSITAARTAQERDLRDAEAALSVAREAAFEAKAAFEARIAGMTGQQIQTDAGVTELNERLGAAEKDVKLATARRDQALAALSPQSAPINGHAPFDEQGNEEQPRGYGVGFTRAEIVEARAALLQPRPTQVRLGPQLGSGVQAAVQTANDWAQSQVASYDVGRVWPFLREQPRIADLFPVDSIDAVERVYFRFLTAADQAAVVAEGDTKPQSSPTTEQFTVTPKFVAHFGQFTRQMLINSPTFLDEYMAEFVGGLNLAVDQQLVSGSGTGELHGIVNAPAINTYTRDTTNEARADAILAGITKVRTEAFVEPTHLIIHPNDLESTRKEKASDYVTSGTGLYLTNPAASLWDEGRLRSLWGLTIVATTSATEGTAIVIDPVTFGRLVLRLPVAVTLDPYTLFTSNGYQILAEVMLDLACVRPKAACLVQDL
jgi:HK97 family phage major capsid protein